MKSLTIETLLNWAFVHELPKGGGMDGLDNSNSAWRMIFASSWGRMAEFAELLTLVDRGTSDNYFIEQGEPHEDALSVGRAVSGLRDGIVAIPDDWNPLADWQGGDPRLDTLVAAATARAAAMWNAKTSARKAAAIVSLVVRSAVLGRGPDWSADMPRIRTVERAGRPAWFVRRKTTDAFGRVSEIEVDGFNPRSGRAQRGAYRKFEFSDDPTADILGRLDHQLWVGALRRLETELSGTLVEHRLQPWGMSMAPWMRAQSRAG